MADKASEKEKSRENKEIENGREADYRSAYEREHLLNADLAAGSRIWRQNVRSWSLN